ncbi:hypothetical protein F4780DRAFT_602651 [Xylariomycetidae sp. FL0641]|nr:hypothetical protein F4780DRAFT_602651 [Xylariomycetidae sp. FL0641]
MPERPSSPKSRNASRSRPANPVGTEDTTGDPREANQSRSSILIGASPSILDSQPMRGPSAMFRPGTHMSNVEPSYRPMSRAAHVRSNSASQGRQFRSVSRGRQPSSKEEIVDPITTQEDCPVPERRPSAPAFRFRSPAEFEAEIKRISPQWHVASYRGPSEGGDENEIIGEIIVRRSPSCAIHGQRQEPASNNDESTQPCEDVARSEANTSQRSSPNPESSKTDGGQPKTDANIDQAGDTTADVKDGAQASPNLYSSSVETLASPKDDDSIPTTPLSAPYAKHLNIAKCMGQELVSSPIARPKSAVW